MLYKKRGFYTITVIFLSGLLALGLGMLDVHSLLGDAVGSSQLAENLGVHQVTAAGAATNRQKGYEFDLEPDGTPNGGTEREGPNNAVTSVPKLEPFAIRVGVQRDGGTGGRLKLNARIEYDTASSFSSTTQITTLLGANHFQIVTR